MTKQLNQTKENTKINVSLEKKREKCAKNVVWCAHNVRAITIQNYDVTIPPALMCHPPHNLGS